MAQNLAPLILARCHYLYLAGQRNALQWLSTVSAAAYLHVLQTGRMSLIPGSDAGDFPYPSFPEQLTGSNQLSSSAYQHNDTSRTLSPTTQVSAREERFLLTWWVPRQKVCVYSDSSQRIVYWIWIGSVIFWTVHHDILAY